MERMKATLPVVGSVNLNFHQESARLYQALGPNEIVRLGEIQHLGVTSRLFVGAKHTRLEYVLLQCALVQTLSHFHRGDPDLALSSQQKLSGSTEKFSSGEELIKCWILIGGAGLLPGTYSSFRALFRWMGSNPQSRENFLPSGLPEDLSTWANSVIDSGNAAKMKLVIGMKHLLEDAKVDAGTKVLVEEALRHLVLPLNELFPKALATRTSYMRLRQIHSDLRLLSMVALDSYYSHQPITVNAMTALPGLGDLLRYDPTRLGFRRVLESTAGWLAEELYLDPKAVALQAEHEQLGARALIDRSTRSKNYPGIDWQWTRLRTVGPTRKFRPRYRHLLRLSFPGRLGYFQERKGDYDRQLKLESQLRSSPDHWLAINRNPYRDVVHVDFGCLTSSAPQTCRDIFKNAYAWLRHLAVLEIRSWRQRRVDLHNPDNKEFLDLIMAQLMRRARPIIASVVQQLIRYAWGDRLTAAPTPVAFAPGPRWPLIRLRLGQNILFDEASGFLEQHISSNPENLTSDEMQAIRACDALLSASRADLVLLQPFGYTLRNQTGNAVDEWDAFIVEIEDGRFRMRVIEAKRLGSPSRNERQALRQLGETAQLLKDGCGLTGRRKPIRGLGGNLVVSF